MSRHDNKSQSVLFSYKTIVLVVTLALVITLGAAGGSGYSFADSLGLVFDVSANNRELQTKDTGTTTCGPPGTLDPSFNGTGTVVTALGPTLDIAYAVAVQADGKIVVAGSVQLDWNDDRSFGLVRYNADGSLDTSFGRTGKVVTHVGGRSVAYGVAIQSDGKIVVSGDSYDGAYYRFAVARYNPDGTLDASFNGTGMVTTHIGARDDAGRRVAIQTDGKIVVSGATQNLTGDYDFGVVRYNPDGTLDISFNGTGKVVTNVTLRDWPNSLAIQPDGKIVLAGATDNNSPQSFAAVRYNVDGSLDTSFNGTGKVVTSFAEGSGYAQSLAIQPDGKIVAAGTVASKIALVRYKSDGSLDNGFNGTGMVTTQIGYDEDVALGVAIQNDGKIVAGGSTKHLGRKSFSAVRYNPDGSIDTTFNVTGKVVTLFGPIVNFYNLSSANAVALQPDGRVILVGAFEGYFVDDFAVARYYGSSCSTPTPTITATPLTVSVSVGTNLAGTFYAVDGIGYDTTRTFDWEAGSSHTLSTSSPQLSGPRTQNRFVSWSDGGAQSHTVVANAPAMYTANFAGQYWFRNDGFLGAPITPPSGFYDAGSSMQIYAPTFWITWHFERWYGFGNGSYTGLANPATIVMNEEITQSAVYEGVTPTATATATPPRTPTSTATGSRTPTATVTASPTPSCSECVGNGTFEAGSPWSQWPIQSSTVFGTTICNTATCGNAGGAAPPFAGNNWAWFGGASGPETARLGQTITIPAAVSTLSFQMRVGTVTAPFTDTLVVTIDGTQIAAFTEPSVAESGYTLRTFDVTAFADGRPHALLFTYTAQTTGVSNFVVDNISVTWSDGPTPTNTATPTATFTPTPTQTQTPFPELDLTISQTAPSVAFSLQQVTYTVTVTNSPAALGGFACPTVRFGYPTGLPITFNSTTGTNGYVGTPDSGGVTFTGGCISSSGGTPMSATLTVVVMIGPTAGGTLTSLGSNVVVDPENAVPENNENNNTAQTVVTQIFFKTQTPTPTFTPTPTNTRTSTPTNTPTPCTTPLWLNPEVPMSVMTPCFSMSPTATATLTPAHTFTSTATATPTANVCPPSYSNSAPIAINDNAAGSPYPSNITVSGLSGLVTGVTVDLVDLTHTFPDDVDIMLVGPGGQNTLLMSDAGLGFDIVRTNLTFDDAVPVALPDDTQISGGTYGPTNYDTTTDIFPAPAPTPGVPVAMGVFIGTNPNGVWSLYVRDDLGVDTGRIGAGWKLHITTSECSTPTGTPTPTGTRTNTPTATPSETPGGFYYIQFSSTTYTEAESRTAAITVTKNGNPSGGMIFSTSDGTATGGTSCDTSGVDYVNVTRNLSFPPGGSTQTVDVQLCGDTLSEPTETIKLTLTPDTIGGSPHTAVLNIIDTAIPTASISGRVLTGSGAGIRNARVVITGNSLTSPIVTTTGSFGYFAFSGLATGETYVVTVNSRRYTFSTPSRVISLVGNVTDADFIADPQE